MRKDTAIAIRRMLDNVIESISATDEKSFNQGAGQINDHAAAIRTWIADRDYVRGDLVIDPADGIPYWAIHNHGKTSGHVCQPSQNPTMWAHCHGTSKETARPFVAESYNPYNTGHYCTEGDMAYRCKQDSIVYPPSVLPSAWEIE